MANNKQWTLEPYSEYRFETISASTSTAFQQQATNPHQNATLITLIDGEAEIFGSELVRGKTYSFGPDTKLALFTYSGCKIEVEGLNPVIEYVSSETPMQQYLNIHYALQRLRTTSEVDDHDQGKVSSTLPPVVLVLGKGRTTLSTLLANYAAKQGGTPILVDLDISRGTICFPGTLAAHLMPRTIDLEEGMQGGDVQPDLIMFYGHTLTKDSPRVYTHLTSNLLKMVKERMGKTGCVIIGPGDIDTADQVEELLLPTGIINVILVIGNERLFSALEQRLRRGEGQEDNGAHDHIILTKVQKSGGVVERDLACKRASHQRQIRTYFYGLYSELSPFNLVLSWSDMRVFRLGHASTMAPRSALPLGATRRVDEHRLVKVDAFDPAMLLSIMAFLLPETRAGSKVEANATATPTIDTPVGGFVHLLSFDADKKTVNILSPCPLPLPTMNFIIGSVRWIEH